MRIPTTLRRPGQILMIVVTILLISTSFMDSAFSAPAIGVDDRRAFEGNSGTRTALFTVTLSSAAASSVTVGYSTADGTAKTLP